MQDAVDAAQNLMGISHATPSSEDVTRRSRSAESKLDSGSNRNSYEMIEPLSNYPSYPMYPRQASNSPYPLIYRPNTPGFSMSPHSSASPHSPASIAVHTSQIWTTDMGQPALDVPNDSYMQRIPSPLPANGMHMNQGMAMTGPPMFGMQMSNGMMGLPNGMSGMMEPSMMDPRYSQYMNPAMASRMMPMAQGVSYIPQYLHSSSIQPSISPPTQKIPNIPLSAEHDEVFYRLIDGVMVPVKSTVVKSQVQPVEIVKEEPKPEPPRKKAKTTSKPQSNKKKRFICDWEGCDKTFSTSANLNRHKTLHLPHQPYPCPVSHCKSRFHRPDTMREHYLAHVRRLRSDGSVVGNLGNRKYGKNGTTAASTPTSDQTDDVPLADPLVSRSDPAFRAITNDSRILLKKGAALYMQKNGIFVTVDLGFIEDPLGDECV
jgi:hypothetical protein